MANPKRILFFLILLQLSAITYGQSAFQVEVANTSVPNAASPIKVHDIPTTITVPPNIAYPSPHIFKINTPINPLAPSNTGGSVPAASYGPQAVFAGPGWFDYVTGLVAEANGTLYAANYGGNKINKISPDGLVSVFAGPVGSNAGLANGPGNQAAFNSPDGVIRDALGNLYVSDMSNQLIRKITPAGMVSTFAGTGTIGTSDNPTGTLASFNTPRGMAIDAAGNIYVADQGSNLIRKISPSGAVSTVAGRAGPGFSDGNTATARFNTPTAVGIDNAGNLYVADTENGAIRKIEANGTVTTVVAGLNRPRELRVDATNNIYVVEQSSGHLLRVSPNGAVNIVSTGFDSPIGLVLDGKGNAYIGASYTIHKVSISGYEIDKTLPNGLMFNPLTGVISGTPTVIWPATVYTITAYNGGGSYSTTVSIAVDFTSKISSEINFPSQQPVNLDNNNNYDPGATSNNHETPIIYTSSNPAVATITSNGMVHVVGPGVSTITATQAGNENYSEATPVNQTLTVTKHLIIDLPAISTKTVCSADFNINAVTNDGSIPVTYTSSNTAVATITAQGDVKIVGAGTTTITISQNAQQPYYVSAQPKSQVLTVELPLAPQVSITPVYSGQCAGSIITFTATGSNAGANPVYQWRVNNLAVGNNASIFSSNTLQNGDNVTCTLINNDNPCLAGFPAISNSSTVALTNPVSTSVSIKSSVNYVFPGTLITFTAHVKNGNTSVNYQWYVNGLLTGNTGAQFQSNDFSDGDKVLCVITPANSCSLAAESQILTVNLVNKVEVPNAFTPNADGVNDTWLIKGLAGYPDCVVSVYSRVGQLLYRSKGYSNEWDGTINGNSLPASTYYYIIDLKFQNKVMSGYVTLIK